MTYYELFKEMQAGAARLEMKLYAARRERTRYREALEEIAEHDLTYPSATTARAALDQKQNPEEDR